MEITKVNAFIAHMHPPSGEPLKGYLRAAILALGGRSDADLARTIGVPASTVASWKRRGSIPESHYTWFTTTLAEKISVYASIDLRVADDPVALAAALLLLKKHSHDPLGLNDQSSAAAPYVLAAMSNLALFLYLANEAEWDRIPLVERIKHLAEVLDGSVTEVGRHIGPPREK